MKKKVLLLFAVGIHLFSMAQNVGINTASPLQRLHVEGGNLLITQPLNKTSRQPVAGQVYTMLNGGVLNYPAGDSTGTVYDPGGAAGNYLANLAAYVRIPPVVNGLGYEVDLTTVDLGVGDTILLSESPQRQQIFLLIIGTAGNNGSAFAGTYKFSTSTLYITFKSNSDASVGAGFALTYKRNYSSGSVPFSNNIIGNALAYNAGAGSLSAGLFRNAGSIGDYSFSAGTSISPGIYGTAVGLLNEVYSQSGFAANTLNKVYGTSGSAFGFNSIAYGDASLAAGYYTNTNVDYSTALGRYNDPYEGDHALLTVGNGNGENARSNAFAVFQNGNATVNGYTSLGKATEGAPSVKMKKITGYNMPSTNESWVFIPAGLSDMNKILSLQVMVTFNQYQVIPNSSYFGSQFRTNVDGTNIAVGTMAGESYNLYGRPIKILIIYEE